MHSYLLLLLKLLFRSFLKSVHVAFAVMLVINNLLRKLQFTGSSIYREVLRCGDFYDRMVGIAKNAICKTLGRKEFSFFAPKEVVLECKFILTLIRLAFLMVVFHSFLAGILWLLTHALYISRRNNPTTIYDFTWLLNNLFKVS